MRFLFINLNRDFARQNIWNVVNSVTPPLGLALLAGVLHKHGHRADIIDAYALDLSVDQVVKKIDPSFDVIGMSSMTVEIDNVIVLARRIRNLYPNIRILLGGVHPSLFHRQLMEGGICDMVIRNEGEVAIRRLADGDALDSIPGLTWRDTGRDIIVNDKADGFTDLNELPYPAYNKLPMHRYRPALGAARHIPSIGMITSRGCPGICTFCFSGMFGRKIRYTAPEIILEHMLHLRDNYGVREISFYDDTFTSHRKRIVHLCEMLIDRRVNMTWSCFARVDSVNPKLLKLMHAAGCHQIMYGFEAFDEKILKAINKSVRVKDYAPVAAMTREAHIDIRGAFMLGSPGETEKSLQTSIDYSKKLGIEFAIYNITTPYPGTAMFEWARSNGMLSHTDWKLYDLAHAILDLPTVSRETVEHYYKRAFREFYLRPSYILKRILAIRTIYEFRTYLQAFLGMLAHVFR